MGARFSTGIMSSSTGLSGCAAPGFPAVSDRKLIILPDLGGRLYSVYDKVDGREVFYRNHVVKYGLIGVRGAWISGGIEFNFPNAHTAVTVSPVESVLLHNPDGSATAVVGAMDWVSNM